MSGYDVRAAVKEQIESLGAKFVSIDLGGAKGEGEGGYARALDDETIRKQREQMAAVMREQDVVITTAAVPGRKAPLLVTTRNGARDAPGIGDRRSGGGARRQLRADSRGRDGDRARRD